MLVLATLRSLCGKTLARTRQIQTKPGFGQLFPSKSRASLGREISSPDPALRIAGGQVAERFCAQAAGIVRVGALSLRRKAHQSLSRCAGCGENTSHGACCSPAPRSGGEAPAHPFRQNLIWPTKIYLKLKFNF